MQKLSKFINKFPSKIDPSFRPPEILNDYFVEAVREGHNQYTRIAGDLGLCAEVN